MKLTRVWGTYRILLRRTGGGVRFDLAYDIKHRSHARSLTDEQAGNQEDEPSIIKAAEQPKTQDPLKPCTSELEAKTWKGISKSIQKQNHRVRIR